MNGAYKILTRILAKRMLAIISQCISEDQIGFMPRTFIAESTMMVKLIQAHLDSIDEGGIFVFLDLEKAFDRVDWIFMKKAIKALRFTKGFCDWADVLYDENNPPKRRIVTLTESSANTTRSTSGLLKDAPCPPYCLPLFSGAPNEG